MKQRIVAILTALCLALSLLPTAAGAADAVGTIFSDSAGIRYRVLTENTVEVIHSSADQPVFNIPSSGYTGNIVIPAKVSNSGNEYKVVGIETFAFIDAKITSITLNEGLEFIDTAAFTNSTLTSIEIPASVTRLGGGNAGEESSLITLE